MSFPCIYGRAFSLRRLGRRFAFFFPGLISPHGRKLAGELRELLEVCVVNPLQPAKPANWQIALVYPEAHRLHANRKLLGRFLCRVEDFLHLGDSQAADFPKD